MSRAVVCTVNAVGISGLHIVVVGIANSGGDNPLHGPTDDDGMVD